MQIFLCMRRNRSYKKNKSEKKIQRKTQRISLTKGEYTVEDFLNDRVPPFTGKFKVFSSEFIKGADERAFAYER